MIIETDIQTNTRQCHQIIADVFIICLPYWELSFSKADIMSVLLTIVFLAPRTVPGT